MVGFLATFIIYFVLKIIFSNGYFVEYQIVNQIVIFILLFFLMRWFSSIDRFLNRNPIWISKIINLIAKLTLEIYLVQYVLIDLVKNTELFFPINWLIVSLLIIVTAYLLHIFVKFLNDKIADMFVKGKNL
ncbi:hypothetical protein BN3662_02177 [Clostridiales bacterium CHKCI006]|nr:hypothetical protein BN3662_02177 [Clostridiales bacterium CHKCI006]